MGKEGYLNALNIDKFWNFRMFAIERRRLKVIFRLRAIPARTIVHMGKLSNIGEMVETSW